MKNKLHNARLALLTFGEGVLDLKKEAGTYPDFVSAGVASGSEALANLTLAFRHVEDARMRLGKAIQALDGGVSVYKD